ncbi:MAG: prolyl-tRNA synthetase [Candidatus Moranbacteria bacterium]|nr:prolyl-tRNA synthetase [Candidatus Moranbacteria bacterium]
MRQSQLFTKTKKEAPKDETSKNAQLLIRAGYVYKVMAGVYVYTPLGLRVLENIKGIVREEMNAIGGQELIMTNLQRKDTWEMTGRWSDEAVDVWFKTKLQDGVELGLAWSHEEAIMEMMQQFIESYKDLPVSVYQFQTKLRNELRAKSGIMRGREFVMKDMYSLHATEEDMDQYYEHVIEAYKKIYHRFGIGDETYVTFASGGAFTKFSHEFQTICSAGEDVLYMNADRTIAVNEEVLDDASQELGINKTTLSPVTTAEVGNIFKFGTEKSDKMHIVYKDKEGKQQPIYLASYGIGITRVMGVIVEKFSDDKGLVWPEAVAPFQVHLISLGQDEKAEEIYHELIGAGIEVLYDDRDLRAGEKFAESDLLGIPYRVIVGKRSLESGEAEVKYRKDGAVAAVPFAMLSEYCIARKP